MRRVLGIDPGYGRLGIAVIEETADRRQILLFSDCLTTPAGLDLAKRLRALGDRVAELLDRFQPELIAIEKLFVTVNQKTASAVEATRGVMLYLAAKHELAVAEYTPLQVKQTITGYGKADKAQVMKMVSQLIKLKHAPEHDDEYDAIAVALTALALYPQPRAAMIAK